ncbi:Aste57867_18059 [Aphanomyces stellatus]|uniref:Aste57867_18059 protein n=1 Tax=Aphanomyces stellatus TaxID=120398 RepID=A0A485L9G5_9STRA|nr:hypothetical protein As57867_017997 [Aphanomyces stellatus]VFT94798.1 Aste57867_18059 [Aphanomyces stellatus]
MAKTRRTVAPTLSWAYLSKWFRVLSNMGAGLLILGTGLLVLILLNQGMFGSATIDKEFQTSWLDFFHGCRLSSTGFVPDSCDPIEANVTGAAAWTAIGQQLATDLQLQPSHVPVFVTSCIMGSGDGNTWAALGLVMSDSAFPVCNPTGVQAVVGMSAVETTATSTYPNGAFLLSTFSDVRPIQAMAVSLTSAPSVTINQGVVKTIVAIDGTRTATSWDQQGYVTSLNSLNRLFLMRVWLVTHFIDISSDVSALPGYSIGKTSKYISVFGWVNYSAVDHYMLLLVFQILICIVSLCLLANDGVITLEGLSGLLKNKPVLTYDILASLERRKVLLVALICSFFFSPLYADAIRYTYDVNGYHYWSLTMMMLAVMMALSWMALLTCLQYLPIPSSWRNRPLCYNAPVLVYCSVLFFVVAEGIKQRGVFEFDNFWFNQVPTLQLNVNGTLWPSGAFDAAEATTPVIYLLMSDLALCVLAAWLVSLVAHKLSFGNVILDTSWTSHNEFLKYVPMPQYVTSLDLDKKNTISIGHKLYCKPSLMVLLGYCTVRKRGKYGVAPNTSGATTTGGGHSSRESSLATDHHHTTSAKTTDTSHSTKGTSHGSNAHVVAHKGGGKATAPSPSSSSPPEYLVVSIYSLVAALLPWLEQLVRPRVVGTISSNVFRMSKSTTTLEQTERYAYSRGDCCG